MIEQPPKLTIAEPPARLSPDLLRRFDGAETANVVDALGGYGALDHRIKLLAGSIAAGSVVGAAITCDAGPGDCFAIFGAIEIAGPGDIIIATTHGFDRCATIGDIMIGMMRNQGVAAFITDGLVRDSAAVIALGLPVYCCGVSPNSPAENGPGTAGLPIIVGNVGISSGDLIVADADGVVVVPRKRIEQTADAHDRVRALESAVKKGVGAGETLDASLRELLASGDVIRVPREEL